MHVPEKHAEVLQHLGETKKKIGKHQNAGTCTQALLQKSGIIHGAPVKCMIE